MKSLRNKVQLIGNVGDEPKFNYFEGDKKVCRIPLATNESYTNKNGERITDTHWHNIVAWNKVADIIEKYVHKGDEIAVEGKLTNRSWEDETGQKKYATEVVIHEILLLERRKEETPLPEEQKDNSEE